MARKGKQETRREAPPGAQATPLAKARWMLEVGDVRRARRFAEEAAASGPEAERAEARALLERLRPDRREVLVAAAVLVLILIATWAAILRAR
jgi:FimV-like protein